MTTPAPYVESEGCKRLKRALLQKVFRGDIIENAKRFKLVGPAYDSMPKNQNGHFWISTARQLSGPLAALHDPAVREVGIIGATQVLKSLAGNIWLPFVMEHDPGDALVTFENDAKAQDFANRRFMPTVRNHPTLSERIKAETVTRHDFTSTKIKSSSMTLEIAGLNDSTVSTFSYRYIWISESWQHYKDGMLDKARKRADRYPDTCKILIESQAGLAKGDLHNWALTAHAVHYEWACPFCQGRQTWHCTNEFGNLRSSDFVAIKPKDAAENWEAPKAGTYSGMKFPAEGTIDERARAATWECHHCATQIADTKENRRAIAESATQNYKILENGFLRSPKSVVFYLPKECNVDNTFEASVKSYLTAKQSAAVGYMQRLTDWHLSERAVFYDAEFAERKAVEISMGSYETDPNLTMPNSHCRQVTADCGKAEDAGPDENRIGLLWFDIWEWDKASNGRQLSYGVVNSWALLAAQQRFWKVPSARTYVDAGWMPSQVEENAVKYFDLQSFGTLKVPHAWKLILGAGMNRRMSVPGTGKGIAYSVDKLPGGERKAHDATGKLWKLNVYKLTWSNLAFEKQLDSILAKGVSQSLEFLPKDKMMIVDLDGKPSVELTKFSLDRCKDGDNKFASYTSQLNSRRFKESSGKYEDYEKSSRPTEFRDTLLMQLAGIAKDGLLGHGFTTDAPQK